MLAYTETGGAGRAMMRLVEGLVAMGDACRVIVRHKGSDSPLVTEVDSARPWLEYLDQANFTGNGFPGHAPVTMMYSGAEAACEPLLHDADVVHLHWIARFLSPEFLLRLSQEGKSLVWTLHDKNPMTGGCHCSYGCNRYEADCHACHLLRDNPYDITAAMLQLKAKYIPESLVVVSPSEWLADCARKSTVFQHHRIEVIPNAIELDRFRPMARAEAKRALGLREDQVAILYGAESHAQLHKGFAHFVQAVRLLSETEGARGAIAEGRLVLLLLGHAVKDVQAQFEQTDIPVHACGYVSEDDELARIYSAADLTVISSTEDNFPNMVLESLACGTPVVGFRTGGIPDAVQEGVNGCLAMRGDDVALADAVLRAIWQCTRLQRNCRPFAERRYSQKQQAEAYRALYEELLVEKRPAMPVVRPFAYATDTKRALGPLLFDAWDEAKSAYGASSRWRLIEMLEGAAARPRVIQAAAQWIASAPYGRGEIALRGAGGDAKKLLACLPDCEPKIGGVLDKNLADGAKFCGYPALSMGNLAAQGVKVILVSSLKYEQEIMEELRNAQDIQAMGIRVVTMSDVYEWQKRQPMQ